MLIEKDFKIDSSGAQWYVVQLDVDKFAGVSSNYLFRNGKLLDWGKAKSILGGHAERQKAIYFDTKKDAEAALEKYLNKPHGWVLESYIAGSFVNEDLNNGSFSVAKVFDTRRAARMEPGKLNTDVVRKVRVDDKGRAIKVIKGR